MNTDSPHFHRSGFHPCLSVFIRGCSSFLFRALTIGALTAALLHAAEPPVASPSAAEAERLARYLRYPSLLRLTDTMLPMDVNTSMLCISPPPQPQSTFIVEPPHTGSSMRLYANHQAVDKAAMWSVDSRFPIGTLLVKEKFESKTGTEASLITVMEKVRDEGKVDDWLFTMISLPDRSVVRERPKVACTECHAKYSRTNFVSGVTFGALRNYLREKPERPPPELLKSLPDLKSAPPLKTDWEPVLPSKLGPKN